MFIFPARPKGTRGGEEHRLTDYSCWLWQALNPEFSARHSQHEYSSECGRDEATVRSTQVQSQDTVSNTALLE